MTVFRLFLFLMTLASFEEYWSGIFVPSTLLHFFSLIFFSGVCRVHRFREEDHRGKGSFPSHHIKGLCSQHDSSLFLLTLDHLTEVVFVMFSTANLLFLSPHFLSCALWKEEVLMCSSYLMRWRVMLYLLEGKRPT